MVLRIDLSHSRTYLSRYKMIPYFPTTLFSDISRRTLEFFRLWAYAQEEPTFFPAILMTFSFLWNTPKKPKKPTNMGPSHWGPNGKTTLGRPFGSSSQRQDIYSSKLTITRTSKMLQQQDPAGFQEWGIPFRKFPILWVAIKFETSKKSSEYDGEDDPGPLDGAGACLKFRKKEKPLTNNTSSRRIEGCVDVGYITILWGLFTIMENMMIPWFPTFPCPSFWIHRFS